MAAAAAAFLALLWTMSPFDYEVEVLKTHWANVWLKKKLFIMHGSHNKLRAKRRQMESRKMLLSCAALTSTMLHCSLNSVAWYNVHWIVYHASTVQWTVEACVYCSLNSEACEQCELHCSHEILFFSVY